MQRSIFAMLLTLNCAVAAKERPYTPPRLDTGQPDMQGVWVASNATPLQRPQAFATLVIDAAQAAKLLAAVDARAEDRSTPTEPTEYFDAVIVEPIRGQLPEQRPAPERCLASRTVQPPILSIRTGVNLHQIVQTADSFVVTSEFLIRRAGDH